MTWVHKGVYPQTDGRLAMAFDESILMHQKGSFVAIVAIHRNGYLRKRFFVFVSTKFKHA